MSTPILTTKLYIPSPRLNEVFRPRLIKRLNDSLLQNQNSSNRLTLISAPAGFGKTTLISEWVVGCKQPVAWLSLDEADSDPSRFLAYLIAALQTITPEIGKEILGLIQTSQPLSMINEQLLASLINEIAAFPGFFILVLDDYHTIESEPIDQALIYLLDHLPPQIRLIIMTREDPSLPLARYRVRGQLTELRAADLRFTNDEACAFLNQIMNLNLSVENIAALESRTEGWIAGLQLAALSMQGRKDIIGFIHDFTGTHRFVLDYLVEEVLKHQPEHIRDFLLQTSILASFNFSLCNAVTACGNGKEVLDILDHNNLFLIPLDDKREWYRYHHLFGEVLHAHLMETQPNNVPSLHRLASRWYEQNGSPADAIHHALAGKDFDNAACLIELAWPATEVGIIQSVTWLEWVKTLPEKCIHNRPALNIDFAYALLGCGEVEAAEARLKDTEDWLDKAGIINAQSENSSEDLIIVDKEQFKSLPATIAIGHAYIAQAFGNIQDTVKYANLVLQLVPEDDSFRHQQASLLLGLTFWATGDLKAADQVFADYTVKLKKNGNIPDAISTTVVLADIRLLLGSLQLATNTVEKLLNFIVEQDEPVTPETADLHRELSELYLEQGNVEAAAQHLKESKILGEKAVLPVWLYRWCIAQARLNESMGDLEGALNQLDDAERLFIRTPLPDAQSISALKARIWIKQGKFGKATDWAGRIGLSPDDNICFLREFEHITLAKILIAQYQNNKVDDSIKAVQTLLDHLQKAAEEGRRNKSLIEILVLQALVYRAMGNISLALVPFERALTLAEPEGFIRIFVDEGKPVQDLLTSIETKFDNLTLLQFVHKLRSAFDNHRVEDPAAKISVGKKLPLSSKQLLIEALSEREVEVLKLLRTELNGPEIARECMVSLTTIRTHTQNIYTKLGVNNRRAAVRRAEELNLF